MIAKILALAWVGAAVAAPTTTARTELLQKALAMGLPATGPFAAAGTAWSPAAAELPTTALLCVPLAALPAVATALRPHHGRAVFVDGPSDAACFIVHDTFASLEVPPPNPPPPPRTFRTPLASRPVL
jgi:hypothetical protein